MNILPNWLRRTAYSGSGDGLEKIRLTLGFIPLTDCAPLVVAKEKGWFQRYGLDTASTCITSASTAPRCSPTAARSTPISSSWPSVYVRTSSWLERPACTVFQDPGAGTYKKLVIKDNKLAGAVLYGDTIDGAWLFQLIRSGNESGWELHIGGNAGVKVRATDVLCRVETAAEVEEYCGAFMQVYREEARYLESQELAQVDPWKQRAEGAEAHEFTALG